MPYKNKFIPKNKTKYIGDSLNIRCRSLWERRFCNYLDSNSKITRWGFECVKIPYYSPIDNKYHDYIPDFIFETKDNNDKKNITVVEIKPLKQTIDPSQRKRIKLEETITYTVNQAKWQSAKEYCEANGWDFKIITERELF